MAMGAHSKHLENNAFKSLNSGDFCLEFGFFLETILKSFLLNFFKSSVCINNSSLEDINLNFSLKE